MLICRDNDAARAAQRACARASARAGRARRAVEIAGREWAVGDRVIARRNDRGLDVDNGTRGTITAVDRAHRTEGPRPTRAGCGSSTSSTSAQHLQHAYAITGHGIQGGTIEAATVVGQPGDFSRNWSYTALSRAREPVARARRR